MAYLEEDLPKFELDSPAEVGKDGVKCIEERRDWPPCLLVYTKYGDFNLPSQNEEFSKARDEWREEDDLMDKALQETLTKQEYQDYKLNKEMIKANPFGEKK